jgi:lipoprotein-anchoring transpeptidase ErfK/SrfK
MAKKKAKKKLGKKKFGYLVKHSAFTLLGALVVIVGAMVLFPQTGPPCANDKTCSSDLTEQIDNSAKGIFQGRTIIPPAIDPAHDTTNPSVLGETADPGEKHIYVDLSTQKLYAFQGDTKVLQSYIASGKWNPTPVGNFHIWTKLRATRMSGGEGADYYNLPNVPYVMYFYQDYGLHGAYWHDNFGHKMSHGCVNLREVDARDLYNWAEIGTPVSVCNTFTEPHSCVQDKPIQ